MYLNRGGKRVTRIAVSDGWARQYIGKFTLRGLLKMIWSISVSLSVVVLEGLFISCVKLNEYRISRNCLAICVDFNSLMLKSRKRTNTIFQEVARLLNMLSVSKTHFGVSSIRVDLKIVPSIKELTVLIFTTDFNSKVFQIGVLYFDDLSPLIFDALFNICSNTSTFDSISFSTCLDVASD